MGTNTPYLNLFKAAKTDVPDIEKAASNNFGLIDTAAQQIANNTAQIETAGTATSPHKSGEYVMISNVLYKVVADVSAGTAWKIGTEGASGVNVQAVNVGSELTSLKNSSTITELGVTNANNIYVNFSKPLRNFKFFTVIGTTEDNMSNIDFGMWPTSVFINAPVANLMIELISWLGAIGKDDQFATWGYFAHVRVNDTVAQGYDAVRNIGWNLQTLHFYGVS